MRLLAAGERAQVNKEVSDPDDHEPDVCIPFRLGPSPSCVKTSVLHAARGSQKFLSYLRGPVYGRAP
jgi:hypothetical protein